MTKKETAFITTEAGNSMANKSALLENSLRNERITGDEERGGQGQRERDCNTQI